MSSLGRVADLTQVLPPCISMVRSNIASLKGTALLARDRIVDLLNS
jgi:hypothetical protein